MDILTKITTHKQQEIAIQKKAVTTSTLENSPYFNRTPISLKAILQEGKTSGIITEFKRHSPSKGDINTHSTVEEVTKGYAENGASGLSILTDKHFFKGKKEDLTAARSVNNIPILRKDFIIDEYQIMEAKAIGADVILLIAECLPKERLSTLAAFAKRLGLEVLMEIHSKNELAKLNPDIDIVGVNNRNLKTFEVDIQTSIDLFDLIPNDFVKISESGISHPNTIMQLKTVGFQGFLIGEAFMKTLHPALTFAKYQQNLMLQSSAIR